MKLHDVKGFGTTSMIKTLLVATGLVFGCLIGGCGDSDDSPAAPPPNAPTGDPNETPREWTLIRIQDPSDVVHDPPCAGREGYLLEIRRDGSFSHEACPGTREGSVTAAEQAQITQALGGVLPEIEARSCKQLQGNESPTYIDVVLSTGQQERVYSLEPQRECTRGSAASAKSLVEILGRIRQTYSVPNPEPEPEPPPPPAPPSPSAT